MIKKPKKRMIKPKKNCNNCGHFRHGFCRKHGYSWKPHIASKTNCEDWKEDKLKQISKDEVMKYHGADPQN